MVENDCRGRSSFSHPNLALFVNPPVQAAAGVITLGGLTGIDRATARRFVALGVSPLASALKAPVVFFVLLGLGLGSPSGGPPGCCSAQSPSASSSSEAFPSPSPFRVWRSR